MSETKSTLTPGKETYDQLQKRHQQEVNAFPMAFAFNDQQFSEGMQKLGLNPSETDQIIAIGGGGFIRKADKPALLALFERHHQERKAAMDADRAGNGFLYEMFSTALSDHEYGYTRDANPALEALGLTWKEINQKPALLRAFRRAVKEQIDWYDQRN